MRGLVRLLAALALATPALAAPQRPNIVLIVADDFGRECLGAYGGTSYDTPNLDRLARSGARFTEVFSTPRCSPSRVTLLTGRYTFRSTNEWGHLPPEEITFGQLLRDAGYATALAGKWQLGRHRDDPQLVNRFGFERYCCWGWEEGPRYWRPLIWQDGEIRGDVQDRYGPDVHGEYLIDFIGRQRDRPFLAYYAMTLTHLPGKDEPPGPRGRRETFAEMVANMDSGVGQLIEALDRLGLRETTLVLFTSDNGSPAGVISQLVDGTVRGGKDLLTDAGTRVPLIASWPGVIAPGAVHDDLIDLSDFLPTLAELAGAEPPRDRIVDGRSFAPLLVGGPTLPREWAYTLWRGRSWVRDREWKLYGDGKLFDMRLDAREKRPVLAARDSPRSAAVRRRLEGAFAQLGPGSR